eukprot:TRINITY_DN1465_c0_g2_i1.p1 TRINITY_DN1465_c0_g2~~TRINITY_DN1465_c0_g2_i1.p1  ORF type:complete len:513 (+),score=154.52 TRINITY_DN1465_c0_g2_i1:100-1539(+)
MCIRDRLIYLPHFLEDLFILLDDTNKEIKNAADNCLKEFIKEIKESRYERTPQLDSEIIAILVSNCKNKKNTFIKLSAIGWIDEYLKLIIEDEKYHDAGHGEISMNKNHVSILTQLNKILEAILISLSDPDENIREAAGEVNRKLLKIVVRSRDSSIEFQSILEILKDMLQDRNGNTIDSALEWMKQFLQMNSSVLIPLMDDVLERLIERLEDPEENVVQKVVEVLGYISLHESYYNLVVEKIIQVFHFSKEMLQSKSTIVIKKLCSIIDPKKVYRSFAEKLITSENAALKSQMVQTLDFLLLTDKDLSKLRNLIKNIQFIEEDKRDNTEFFEILYSAWCFNPVSTVTFCLLSQNYELAYYIITSFADIEMDVETLVQVAKLIQLIESPIFVYLRLQLLEAERYPYLLKSLYGLLMLLPQGKAFNALRQRLQNTIRNESPANGKSTHPINDSLTKPVVNKFDIARLVEIYRKAQNLKKQ